MIVADNALVEGWPLCSGWEFDMGLVHISGRVVLGYRLFSPVCLSCVLGGDYACYVSRKSWELIVLILGYTLKSNTDSNGNSREVEVLRDSDGTEPVLVKRSEVEWISDAAVIEMVRDHPLFKKLKL